MASKFDNNGSPDIEQGTSLLRNVVGVAPLAAGAFVGFSRIRSNGAVVNPLTKPSTPNKVLGQKLSATARRAERSRNEAATQAVEKIKEMLNQGVGNNDLVDRMAAKVQERNALLQSLAVTIESPLAGVTDVEETKAKILSLLDDGSESDVRQFVKNTINTILENGSDELKILWGDNLRNFQRVSDQLEAPQMNLKSGTAFRPLDEASAGTPNKVRTLLNRLRSNLPVGFTAELHSAPSPGGGADMIVAQISSRTGRHKSSIPLQLGGFKDLGGRDTPAFTMLGKDFNTLYAAPSQAINMQQLARSSRGSTAISRRHVRMIDMPVHFVDLFTERARGGSVSFTDFNEAMRATMVGVDRAALSTRERRAGARHQIAQAFQEVNAVYLFGYGAMPTDEAVDLTARLASSAELGLDPGSVGAKRGLSGAGVERRGVIGRLAGSGMESLQRTYGTQFIDRSSLPVTARESQVLGRPAVFADEFRLLKGSHIGIGGTAGRLGQNIGLGVQVTGGANKFVFADFRGSSRLSKDVRGQGMAYTALPTKRIKTETISVLDPHAHQYSAGRVYNEVIGTQTGYRKYPASEIPVGGLYMGETGDRSKKLHATPFTTEAEIEYVGRGRSAGKEMTYMSARLHEDLTFSKHFGLTLKVNVKTRGVKAIERMVQEDRPLQAAVAQAQATFGTEDINLQERAIFTTSDQFKKAGAFFIHHAGSVGRMHGITAQRLFERAQSLADRQLSLYRKGSGAAGLQHKRAAQYATALVELMAEKGASAADIGHALVPIFGGKGDVGFDALSPATTPASQARISQATSAVEALLSRVFQGDKGRIGAAMGAVRSGVTYYVETAAPGPSQGDWARGMVGSEQRVLKTIAERLRSMGMSVGGATDIVSEIYSGKIGLARHSVMAREMLELAKGLTGQAGISDAIRQRGFKRVTFKQLPGLMGAEGINDFLSKQQGGLLLSFQDAPEHVLNTVRKVFGSPEIYLPGQEAYEASLGTTIKQADGGTAKAISGPFGQVMEKLFGQFERFENPVMAGELEAGLRAAKQDALDLTARTVSGLTAGKLAGTSSPRAETMNLAGGMAGMTSQERKMVARIFERTRATGMLADDVYFLNELASQRGVGVGKGELVTRARQFFTGLEYMHSEPGRGAAMGQIIAAGRHPYMGSGNAFFAQYFRDPRLTQVGGSGEDAFFSSMKHTLMSEATPGVHADVRKVLGRVTSFRDISQLEKGEQRAVFTALLDNLDQFTNNRGGGVVTMLRETRQIEVDGKLTSLDVGMSAQAFLDADGDTVTMIRLKSESAKRVRQLIAQNDVDAARKFLSTELRARTMVEVFSERIKAGMKTYGREAAPLPRPPSNLSPEEAAAFNRANVNLENIKKEYGVNVHTGLMDERLRPAHAAIMDYGGGGHLQQADRNLLAALQENIILKAKHMPRYTDLANEVGAAFGALSTAPTDENIEGLRRVLLDKVFRGQSPDIVIGAIQGDPGTGVLKRADAAAEFRYSIDDFVTRLGGMMRQYHSGGGAKHSLTKGASRRALRDAPGEYLLEIATGSGMEGGAVGIKSAAAETAAGVERVKQALNAIDHRMTVPLAVGAAASMVVLGALGSPGYAPEPILMPGEAVDPRVGDAIARGSLFKAPDPQVSMDVAPGGGQYPTVQAPLNVGTTYMNRPGVYSVRGQLSNMQGVTEAIGALNSLTGGNMLGSVRINDARRPITQNYVDRLLGEY